MTTFETIHLDKDYQFASAPDEESSCLHAISISKLWINQPVLSYWLTMRRKPSLTCFDIDFEVMFLSSHHHIEAVGFHCDFEVMLVFACPWHWFQYLFTWSCHQTLVFSKVSFFILYLFSFVHAFIHSFVNYLRFVDLSFWSCFVKEIFETPLVSVFILSNESPLQIPLWFMFTR